MPARLFGRVTAAAAALAATTLLAPAATADDTAPPVVVGDTVELYPGEAVLVDVLANDSSPSGDDLALCRLPEPDLTGSYLQTVFFAALPALVGEGAAGDLLVMPGPKARGTHEIEYYVCDHTHLVPAVLTVVVREVAPVDVATVPGRPGRLEVTNHNDHGIRFVFGHPRAHRPDGRVRVAAGATEIVRVQRHRVAWIAYIGSSGGKGDIFHQPGIADHGRIGGIELRGEPLPLPGPHHSVGKADGVPFSALHRWAPQG